MDFNQTLYLLERDSKVPYNANFVRKSAEDILRGKKTKQEIFDLLIPRGLSKQSIEQGLKYWGIK